MCLDIFEKYSFSEKVPYYELENELEDFNLDEHPSLSIGVDELRRLYDEEEDRRRTVESKTGGLVAINALLIGLVRVVPDDNLYTLPISAVVALIIISTCLSLWNFQPREYRQPVNTKAYPDYTRNKNDEFESTLFIKYTVSTLRNKEINDVRYRWLRLSVLLTGLAVVGLGLTALAKYL